MCGAALNNHASKYTKPTVYKLPMLMNIPKKINVTCNDNDCKGYRNHTDNNNTNSDYQCDDMCIECLYFKRDKEREYK